MTMLNQKEAVVNIEFLVSSEVVEDLDVAGDWGFTDGIEGEDARGGVYYTLGSLEWHSYTDAYTRGLEARRELACMNAQITMQLPELDFMAAALDALRSGDCEAPFARLTDEQMEAIEAERPGHELCTQPWNW